MTVPGSRGNDDVDDERGDDDDDEEEEEEKGFPPVADGRIPLRRLCAILRDDLLLFVQGKLVEDAAARVGCERKGFGVATRRC